MTLLDSGAQCTVWDDAVSDLGERAAGSPVNGDDGCGGKHKVSISININKLH